MSTNNRPTAGSVGNRIGSWQIASSVSQFAFTIGDCVQTTSGTTRIGRVCQVLWHSTRGCAMFFIEVDGKRISRRYLQSELRRIELPENNLPA